MSSYFNPAWSNAPRIVLLKKAFEDIANEFSGKPSKGRVSIDQLLIKPGTPEDQFRILFDSFAGPFDAHYLASIPYIFEENCRQGCAVVDWLSRTAREDSRSAQMLTIETSEATFSRSVVTLAKGRVKSLSTSSTLANQKIFQAKHPAAAHFLAEPFFNITPERLMRDEKLACFGTGFDIIIEDTAFQMYGSDRLEQIGFVAQNLRPDGILICIEKCLHTDETEYDRRDFQKDFEFKTKYFSDEELLKKQAILHVMKRGQVYLDELSEALQAHFYFCNLTWSSGNFLVLVASNNEVNLQNFTDRLGPPRIPKEFMAEQPRRLF